jgi:hypothetical protein
MGIDGLAGDAGFDNYRNSFISRPAQARGGVSFGSSGNNDSGGGQ